MWKDLFFQFENYLLHEVNNKDLRYASSYYGYNISFFAGYIVRYIYYLNNKFGFDQSLDENLRCFVSFLFLISSG